MSQNEILEQLLKLEDNIIRRLKEELTIEFVNKKEFYEFKDDVLTKLDYVFEELKDINQHLIFLEPRLERIETEQNSHINNSKLHHLH